MVVNAQFKVIQTGDSQLDRIQANIRDALNSVSSPFVGGRLLTGVAVGTGDTVINHGLGRTPQVWVLCDQNTNTTVWRTAWNSSSITLRAGSACTINLWVD